MSRHFPIVTERRGPRTFRTCFVTCKVCGEQGDIGNQNFGADTADEQAPQKFRDRGWFIGRTPSDDLCPKHAKRAKPACEPTPEVVTTTTEEPAVTEQTAITAEPPRAMTFLDRRVILQKIEDVYLDEKTGYSSGWSDKKVASDLNVPLAWVAELREQNFGPAINEDFVELMKEFAGARDVFDACREGIGGLEGEMRRVRAWMQETDEYLKTGFKATEALFNELKTKFEKFAP